MKLRTVRPALDARVDDETQELPALSLVPTPGDPLVDAAVAVLTAAGSRGLPATELYDRLPDWARRGCASPHALGLALSRHPGLVARAHIGSVRGWKLTSAARSGSSARVR